MKRRRGKGCGIGSDYRPKSVPRFCAVLMLSGTAEESRARPLGMQSRKARICEGFRTPAFARALMQGCRLGAGVRKPPREETAGRRGAGGERRGPMGIWRSVERRAVLLRARFVAGREQRSGLRPAD